MLYTSVFGFNIDLIKAALVIGCYDIFGTIMLIILEIEFFSQSTFFTLINFCGICRMRVFVPAVIKLKSIDSPTAVSFSGNRTADLSVVLLHRHHRCDFADSRRFPGWVLVTKICREISLKTVIRSSTDFSSSTGWWWQDGGLSCSCCCFSRFSSCTSSTTRSTSCCTRF